MKAQKGITLVEALVTLGITSVVGVLLLVIIVNTSGVFYKESSILTQGLNINDALGKITQSIKESSGVASSYQVYTSGPTQLILKIPSVDSSGNIISQTFDFFVFFLDSNGSSKKLVFKTFPDNLSHRKAANQIFSTNVQSLLFQYYNSQIPPSEVAPNVAVKIKTTLTLKQKAGARFETSIATGEANLRND